jgi:hypothetical protein
MDDRQELQNRPSGQSLDTIVRLSRGRYLLRRIGESPLQFLIQKAILKLRKRLDRRRIMHAPLGGSVRTHRGLVSILEFRQASKCLRSDMRTQLARIAKPTDLLVDTLAGPFDDGFWRCLGYGRYSLAPPRWHTDEFNDYTWSRDYFADIDYLDQSTRSDVKVPWEKSRFQWFSSAALASIVDPDPERRRARVTSMYTLFDNWCLANPFGVGINWISAMEVAIRSINLLVGAVLIEDRLSDAELKTVLTSAEDHLIYLKRYPETSDVQGNHFLATTLGLYCTEVLLRPGSDSNKLSSEFIEACADQFTEDGMHVEFAPTYHRLCLDMMLLGQALMRRQRPHQARGLDSLVASAAGVCHALASASGELPIFGDNDSGMVLDFGQSDRGTMAYRLVLSSGGAVGGDQGGAGIGEQALAAVLNGLSGCGFETVSQESASGSVPAEILLIEPFAVLARGNAKVVVRAGNRGLSGRASHDHDDNLSFWYSVEGKDVVIESGCAPYTRDPRERIACIGSKAHNVISACDNLRSEPDMGSVMATARRAPIASARIVGSNGRRRLVCELAPGAEAPELGCPQNHRREFEWTLAGQLLIIDTVSFEASTNFELRLHLAPASGESALSINSVAQSVACGNITIKFQMQGCADVHLSIEQYEFSSRYGEARNAPCVVLQGRADEAFRIETLIHVEGQAEDLDQFRSGAHSC